MKKFKNIKILVSLFAIFSLFSLSNVSAMEKDNNFSKKEISLEKKTGGAIHMLNLNVPEYLASGYSEEIVDRLKNIDVNMSDFVKTSFEKYDFKNKGVNFNGKGEDILKFYEIMYKDFVSSFEQLKEFKEYSIYDPKNIEYIGISEDCSNAYFKFNCYELTEDKSIENIEDNHSLERYACKALIREIILYYIKSAKQLVKQNEGCLICFNPNKYVDKTHETKLKNVLYEVSKLMEKSLDINPMKQRGIKFNSYKDDILNFYKMAYEEAAKIISNFFEINDYSIYRPENVEDISILKDGYTALFKFKDCSSLNKNLTEKNVRPINYPVKKDVYEAVVEQLLLKYVEGERQNKEYLINLDYSGEYYNEIDKEKKHEIKYFIQDKKEKEMKFFEEKLSEYVKDSVDEDYFKKRRGIRFDGTDADILNFYREIYFPVRSFYEKNIPANDYESLHIYDPANIESIKISANASTAILKFKYNDYFKNNIEKYLPGFGNNVLKRDFSEIAIRGIILAYIKGLEQSKQYSIFVNPSKDCCEYSEQEVKNVEEEVPKILQGNSFKNIIKNEEIEFNGEREDMLKYYRLAYNFICKDFNGKLFKDEGSLIYNPANIKNIEILDDASKVIFKFKYNGYVKNKGAKYLSLSNDNVLKEDVNQAAVKQIILFYIKFFKKYMEKQNIDQNGYLIDLDPSKNLIIEYSDKTKVEKLKDVEREVSNLLEEKLPEGVIKNKGIKFNLENDDILKYYRVAYELISELFERKFNSILFKDEGLLIYNPENIKSIKISSDASTAIFKFKYNEYVKNKGIINLSNCYGNVFRRSYDEAAIRQIILYYINLYRNNFNKGNNLSKKTNSFENFLQTFPSLSSDVFDLSYNRDEEIWENHYWQPDALEDYFRRILYFLWDLDIFDKEGEDGVFQDFIRYGDFINKDHLYIKENNNFILKKLTEKIDEFDEADLRGRMFGHNLKKILNKMGIKDYFGEDVIFGFDNLKNKIMNCKEFNDFSQKEKNFYYMYMFFQKFLEYFKDVKNHKNGEIVKNFKYYENKIFEKYKKSKEDYYKFLGIYYSLKERFDVYDKVGCVRNIKDDVFENAVKSFTLDRNIAPDFKTILEKNLLKPFCRKFFSIFEESLKESRDYDEINIIVEMFKAKMKDIFIENGKLCCKTIDGVTHNFSEYVDEVFKSYYEDSLDYYSTSRKQKFTALRYFRYFVKCLDKAVSAIPNVLEIIEKEKQTKEENELNKPKEENELHKPKEENELHKTEEENELNKLEKYKNKEFKMNLNFDFDYSNTVNVRRKLQSIVNKNVENKCSISFDGSSKDLFKFYEEVYNKLIEGEFISTEIAYFLLFSPENIKSITVSDGGLSAVFKFNIENVINNIKNMDTQRGVTIFNVINEILGNFNKRRYNCFINYAKEIISLYLERVKEKKKRVKKEEEKKEEEKKEEEKKEEEKREEEKREEEKNEEEKREEEKKEEEKREEEKKEEEK